MSRPLTLRRRLRRRWKNRPGAVPWLLALPQRALFRLLGLLPFRLALALGDRAGRLIWLSPRRRTLGRRHLRQALPVRSEEERDALLKRSCGHLGRSAVEAIAIWPRADAEFMRAHLEVEPAALELLERYRGRGAIFIQPHLGSIEMTSTVLTLHGLEPGTPMRLPRNHYLAQDLLRARNRGGAEVLGREGALKRMLVRLREGKTLVLTFDQNAHRKPIFVPWFGRLAATERTPAALALKTGAPVLVSWTARAAGARPWVFRCALLRDAGPPKPAGDKELVAMTAAFHRALQEVILRHPGQYLWIHDRYRTRPEGE